MRLVEDGGGAVLEPKDLSGKFEEDLYIELNCSRGRVRNDKRLFKAKYVFDCVRRGSLLPNLSEYLCNRNKEDRSRDEMIEGQMEGTRDPFQVCLVS